MDRGPGHAATRSAPVGRIHWAGAETATGWDGYIEGAIRSGETAAASGAGIRCTSCVEVCGAASQGVPLLRVPAPS
ncbi:FAD-dependent oxidoreductase [Nonomuraea dietziae]|uniref:FAD-dependent oxidoreductase n=1 Tax=Nonomuraea dietziae TaxID=65515 RepID=UPI00340E6C0C